MLISLIKLMASAFFLAHAKALRIVEDKNDKKDMNNIDYQQNNVSLTRLLTEIQRASNSPSKIRGGQGALMIPKSGISRSNTNAPALSGTPS